MNLIRYPKYKNSGIEWIGDIPDSWNIDRIKASIKSCNNGIWGDEPSGDSDNTICIRVADFNRDNLSVDISEPTLRFITDRERSNRLLKKGDLLIEKSGGGENQPVGCVVLYNHDAPAVCSNFIAKMSLKPGMHPSFWKYVHAAAYSIRLTVGSINQTSGIQNLDQDRYFNEKVAFPGLDEQKKIADFLDRETAKIDELIQKQEKLVELLGQKIESEISNAVTKGINRQVVLKDSDVKWIRKIPSHWEIRKSRYLFSQRKELSRPGDAQLTASQKLGIISQSEFMEKEGKVVQVLIGSDILKHVEPNDFVISMRSFQGGLELSRVSGCISSAYVMLAPDLSKVSPEFFKYLFKSQIYIEALQSTSNLIRDGQALRYSNFTQVDIPLPPLDEQIEISKHLDKKLLKLNNLIKASQKSILLLREHRTSLISSVVTGKIDVRDAA